MLALINGWCLMWGFYCCDKNTITKNHLGKVYFSLQ